MEFDGHINRNIRLATAMIDMSKPYINVERITRGSKDDELDISFVVSGCAEINAI